MSIAGQDAGALAARLTFTPLDGDNVHVALNTFKLGVVPDVAPARVVAVIDVSGSMEDVSEKGLVAAAPLCPRPCLS